MEESRPRKPKQRKPFPNKSRAHKKSRKWDFFHITLELGEKKEPEVEMYWQVCLTPRCGGEYKR